MPELPEVETIRRGIVQKLKGKEISKIDIKVPKLFVGEPKDVVGAKIIDAKRVAKILEIVLSNGYSILVHLKLTGQLVYRDEKSEKTFVGGHSQKIYMNEPPHNYTYIVYTFSDGSHLFYNDFRKFGWNKVVKSDEVAKIIGDFGPEPLRLRSGQADDKEFTEKYLKSIFSKTKKPIKIVLMDQAKISGIGNIYANDGLYDAGILPTRPANSLSDSEISKLKSSIEKVLKLGLKYGGSSENTYVDIEGKRGRYMEVARVYQKKLDPAGHPLKKIQLGGRGTSFCPKCQK